MHVLPVLNKPNHFGLHLRVTDSFLFYLHIFFARKNVTFCILRFTLGVPTKITESNLPKYLPHCWSSGKEEIYTGFIQKTVALTDTSGIWTWLAKFIFFGSNLYYSVKEGIKLLSVPAVTKWSPIKTLNWLLSA